MGVVSCTVFLGDNIGFYYSHLNLSSVLCLFGNTSTDALIPPIFHLGAQNLGFNGLVS